MSEPKQVQTDDLNKAIDLLKQKKKNGEAPEDDIEFFMNHFREKGFVVDENLKGDLEYHFATEERRSLLDPFATSEPADDPEEPREEAVEEPEVKEDKEPEEQPEMEFDLDDVPAEKIPDIGVEISGDSLLKLQEEFKKDMPELFFEEMPTEEQIKLASVPDWLTKRVEEPEVTNRYVNFVNEMVETQVKTMTARGEWPKDQASDLMYREQLFQKNWVGHLAILSGTKGRMLKTEEVSGRKIDYNRIRDAYEATSQDKLFRTIRALSETEIQPQTISDKVTKLFQPPPGEVATAYGEELRIRRMDEVSREKHEAIQKRTDELMRDERLSKNTAEKRAFAEYLNELDTIDPRRVREAKGVLDKVGELLSVSEMEMLKKMQTPQHIQNAIGAIEDKTERAVAMDSAVKMQESLQEIKSMSPQLVEIFNANPEIAEDPQSDPQAASLIRELEANINKYNDNLSIVDSAVLGSDNGLLAFFGDIANPMTYSRLAKGLLGMEDARILGQFKIDEQIPGDTDGHKALKKALASRSSKERFDDAVRTLLAPHQKLGVFRPDYITTEEFTDFVEPEEYDNRAKTFSNMMRDFGLQADKLRSQIARSTDDAERQKMEEELIRLTKRIQFIEQWKESLVAFIPGEEVVEGALGERKLPRILVPSAKSAAALGLTVQSMLPDIRGVADIAPDIPFGFLPSGGNKQLEEIRDATNVTEEEFRQIKSDVYTYFEQLAAAQSITNTDTQELFDPNINDILKAETPDDVLKKGTPIGEMRYKQLPSHLRKLYAAVPPEIINNVDNMKVHEVHEAAQKAGLDLFELDELMAAARMRIQGKEATELFTDALKDLMTLGSYTEFDDRTGSVVIKQSAIGNVMNHYLPLFEEVFAEAMFSVAEYGALQSGMTDKTVRSFEGGKGMLHNYMNRLIANANIGQGGFMEMSQDQAYYHGYDRDSSQYAAITGFGMMVSFLFPSENLVFKGVTAPFYAAGRGRATYKMVSPIASTKTEKASLAAQSMALGALNYQVGDVSIPGYKSLHGQARMRLADALSQHMNVKARGSKSSLDFTENLPFREEGNLKKSPQISPENLLGILEAHTSKHLVEMGRNPLKELVEQSQAQKKLSPAKRRLSQALDGEIETKVKEYEAMFNKLGVTYEDVQAGIDIRIKQSLPGKLLYAEEFLREGPPAIREIRNTSEWQDMISGLRKLKEDNHITADELRAQEAYAVVAATSAIAEHGPEAGLAMIRDLTVNIVDDISDVEPTTTPIYRRIVDDRMFGDDTQSKRKGSGLASDLNNKYVTKADQRVLRRSGLISKIEAHPGMDKIRFEKLAQLRLGARAFNHAENPGSVMRLNPEKKTALQEIIGLQDRPAPKESTKFLDVLLEEGKNLHTARIHYTVDNMNRMNIDFIEGSWVEKYDGMDPQYIVSDDFDWRQIVVERALSWATESGLDGAVVKADSVFGQRVFPDGLLAQSTIKKPKGLLQKNINMYLKQWQATSRSTKDGFNITFNDRMKADGAAFRDSKLRIAKSRTIAPDPTIPFGGVPDRAIITKNLEMSLADSINEYRELNVMLKVNEEKLSRLPKLSKVRSVEKIFDDKLDVIDWTDPESAKQLLLEARTALESEEVKLRQLSTEKDPAANSLADLVGNLNKKLDGVDSKESLEKAKKTWLAKSTSIKNKIKELQAERVQYMDENTGIPSLLSRLQEQAPGVFEEDAPVTATLIKQAEEIKARRTQERTSQNDTELLEQADEQIQSMHNDSIFYDYSEKLAADKIPEDIVDDAVGEALSKVTADDQVKRYRDINKPNTVVYQADVGGKKLIDTRMVIDDTGRHIRVVDNFHFAKNQRPSMASFLGEISERNPGVEEVELSKIQTQLLANLANDDAIRYFDDIQSSGRRAVRAFVKRVIEDGATSIGWNPYTRIFGEAILEEFATQGINLREQVKVIRNVDMTEKGRSLPSQPSMYFYVDLPEAARTATRRLSEPPKESLLSFHMREFRGADGIEYTELADGIPVDATFKSSKDVIKSMPPKRRKMAEAIAKWTGMDRMFDFVEPDQPTPVGDFLEQFNVQWGQELSSKISATSVSGLLNMQMRVTKEIQDTKAMMDGLPSYRKGLNKVYFENALTDLEDIQSDIAARLSELEAEPEVPWYSTGDPIFGLYEAEARSIQMTIPVDLNRPVGYDQPNPNEAGPRIVKYYAEPNVRVSARVIPIERDGKRYMYIEQIGTQKPFPVEAWSDIAVRHLTHLAAREGFDFIGFAQRQSEAADSITTNVRSTLQKLSEDWETSFIEDFDAAEHSIKFDLVEITDEMQNSVIDRASPLFSRKNFKKMISDAMREGYGSARVWERMTSAQKNALIEVENARSNGDLPEAPVPDFLGWQIRSVPPPEGKRPRFEIINPKGKHVPVRKLRAFQKISDEDMAKLERSGLRTIGAAKGALIIQLYGHFNRRDKGAPQVGRLYLGFNRQQTVDALRYEPTAHVAVFSKKDGVDKLVLRKTEQKVGTAPAMLWRKEDSDLITSSNKYKHDLVVNSPSGEAFDHFGSLLFPMLSTNMRKMTVVMPTNQVILTLPVVKKQTNNNLIKILQREVTEAIEETRSRPVAPGMTPEAFLPDLQQRTLDRIQSIFNDEKYNKLFQKNRTIKIEEETYDDIRFPAAGPAGTRLRSGSLFVDYAGATKRHRRAMVADEYPRVATLSQEARFMDQYKYGLQERQYVESADGIADIKGLSKGSNDALKGMIAEDIVENFEVATSDQIANMLGMDTMDSLPDFLQGMQNHLVELKRSFRKKQYKPSDIAKAYIITVGSMAAQEISYSLYQNHFLKQEYPDDWHRQSIRLVEAMTGSSFTFFRDGVEYIRPESAVAAWLACPWGKKALKKIDEGTATPEDFKDLEVIRSAFGKSYKYSLLAQPGKEVSKTGRFAEYANRSISENFEFVADRINTAKKHESNPIGEIQKIITDMPMIKDQKFPFIMQFLGLGTKATIDAQELNAWLVEAIPRLKMTADVYDADKAKLKEKRFALHDYLGSLKLANGKTVLETITEKIRQQFNDFRDQPALQNIVNNPFFDSILHQWIWSHMKGMESSQPDLFERMLDRDNTNNYQNKYFAPFQQLVEHEWGAKIVAKVLLNFDDASTWSLPVVMDRIVAKIGEYERLDADYNELVGVATKQHPELAELDSVVNRQPPTAAKRQEFRDQIASSSRNLYQTGPEGQKEGRYSIRGGLRQIDVVKIQESPLAFAHEMTHLLQDIMPSQAYQNLAKDYDHRIVDNRRVLTRAGREQQAEDMAKMIQQGFLNKLPAGRRQAVGAMMDASKSYLQAYKSSPFWVRMMAKIDKWDAGNMPSLEARWLDAFQFAEEAWIEASLQEIAKDKPGSSLSSPKLTIGEPIKRMADPIESTVASERAMVGDKQAAAARRESMNIPRIPQEELLQDLGGQKLGSTVDLGVLSVGSEVDPVELFSRVSGYVRTNKARNLARFRTYQSVVMTARTIVPQEIAEHIQNSIQERLSDIGLTPDVVREKIRRKAIPEEIRRKFPGLSDEQIVQKIRGDVLLEAQLVRPNEYEILLTSSEKEGLHGLVDTLRGEHLGSHIPAPEDLFRKEGDNAFAIDAKMYNEINDAMVDVSVPIGSRRHRYAESVTSNALELFFNHTAKQVKKITKKFALGEAAKQYKNKLVEMFIPKQPGAQKLSPKVSELFLQVRRELNTIEDKLKFVVENIRAENKSKRWRPPAMHQIIRSLRRTLLPPVETTNLEVLRRLIDRINTVRSGQGFSLLKLKGIDFSHSIFNTADDAIQNGNVLIAQYRSTLPDMTNITPEDNRSFQKLLNELQEYNNGLEKSPEDEARIVKIGKELDIIVGRYGPEPMSIDDVFVNDARIFRQMVSILNDGRAMRRSTYESVRFIESEIIPRYSEGLDLTDETIRASLDKHLSSVYAALERKMTQVEMYSDSILSSVRGKEYNSSQYSSTYSPAALQRLRFKAYTLFYDGKIMPRDIDIQVISRDKAQYRPANPPNELFWQKTDVISIGRNNGAFKESPAQKPIEQQIDELLLRAENRGLFTGRYEGLQGVRFSKIVENTEGADEKLAMVANYLRSGDEALRSNEFLLELGGRTQGASYLPDDTQIKTNLINQSLEMISRLMAHDTIADLSERLTQLHLYGDIRETSQRDLIRAGLNPMSDALDFEERVAANISRWLRNEPLNVSNDVDKAAMSRAQEIVDAYGLSQEGTGFDKFVEHVYPDGSRGLLPEEISEFMTEALNRVVPAGSEVGSLRSRDIRHILKYRKRANDVKNKVDQFIYERFSQVKKVGDDTGASADDIYTAIMKEKYLPHLQEAVKNEKLKNAALQTARVGTVAGGLGVGMAFGPLGAVVGGVMGTILAKKVIPSSVDKNNAIKTAWSKRELEMYARWSILEYSRESVEGTAAKKALSRIKEVSKTAMRESVDFATRVAVGLNPLDANSVLIRTVKMGVTVGIYCPTFAYYFSVAMGAPIQAQLRLGTKKAVRSLPGVRTVYDKVSGAAHKMSGGRLGAKYNPEFSIAVSKRLFGDGYRKEANSNQVVVSRSGKIYSPDMIADMMILHGAGSGFIKAEMSRALAQDLYENSETGFFKLIHELGGKTVNQLLIDSAEGIDNVFRVNLFTDMIIDGYSPESAAKLVRETMFDYSDLTDFERDRMRSVFLFYAFMRKNHGLVWWSLLNEPSRLAAHFRLTRNLQRSAVEDEPEITIDEFYKLRPVLPYMKKFESSSFMSNMYQGKMYLMPATNGPDGIKLILDFMNAMGGNQEAMQGMLGSMHPTVSLIGAAAYGKMAFGGRDIHRIQIPNEIVELDATLGLPIFGYGTKDGYIQIKAEAPAGPSKTTDIQNPYDKRSIRYFPVDRESALKFIVLNQYAQGLQLPTSPFFGRSSAQTAGLIRLNNAYNEGKIELREGESEWDVMAEIMGLRGVNVKTRESVGSRAASDVLNTLRERQKTGRSNLD